MSRFEQKKPSLCTVGPLTLTSIKEPLNVLQTIVTSSYGPSGRLKQVHNGSGGSVSTTSQSSTLLSGLSITHPVLQLLVASIRNHISNFRDGGLFAAILCCNLVDRCMGLPVPSHKIIKINKSLLDMCLSYMKSEDCACKISLDFSRNDLFYDLARSVLCSKPACMITMEEIDYVSVLLVKAFLFKVPNQCSPNMVLGRTVIVPVEGLCVKESIFVPGVLIEMPGFTWSRVVPSSGLPTVNIKLALLSVSLSGELSDAGDGTIDVACGVDPEQVMLDQLFALMTHLVEDHVNVLVCQKVIHPSVKQYLKEHDVLAVERLGAALMEPLSTMTGAQSIASLSPASSACYGRLRQLSKMSHGNKHYLHLIPFDTSVCSLILCNRSETSLKELTTTCQAAEQTLHLLLKDPWLLIGGGCAETHLAAYVRYQSTRVPSCHLKELTCSATDYKLVAEYFCSCLESVARSLEHDGGEVLTDLKDGHCWSVPPDANMDFHCSQGAHRCGCRLLTKEDDLQWSVLGSACQPFSPQQHTEPFPLTPQEPIVVDSYSAKRNGLTVAVETASLVLDLVYVVKDEN